MKSRLPETAKAAMQAMSKAPLRLLTAKDRYEFLSTFPDEHVGDAEVHWDAAVEVNMKAIEQAQAHRQHANPRTEPIKTRSKATTLVASSNPLLSAKWSLLQAAKVIGIGATKLRAFVMAGAIPTVKIGGKYLFFEKDVAQFVANRYGPVSTPKIPSFRRASIPDEVLNSRHLRRRHCA